MYGPHLLEFLLRRLPWTPSLGICDIVDDDSAFGIIERLARFRIECTRTTAIDSSFFSGFRTNLGK